MVTVAVSKEKVIEPSFLNALPHFLPVVVFPLIFAAAINGGWWIVGPLIFFMIVGPLDLAFGKDDRNMDPESRPESSLFWYNLPVWLWALLWPLTFVFTLWQIFIVGHLVLWEVVLMVLILAVEGQAVFIVGHELIHRRSGWERYIGEFLLASGSYPHYATEHFYVHHAHVGTPMDVGSAFKGQSFWRYFPLELVSNIRGARRMVRNRMARRNLPIWHYSNPFWRYGIETAAWYALIYVLGGWWAVLIYMALCFGNVFSMKISNYIQHYGLRRIRLPNGRFERVLPRHSWGANFKFSKWMFFNMQRHPDHHAKAWRNYPLLQHYEEDESPQLPGSYGAMFNLAVRPKRWFETMDPLVDQWRARFYPEIKDWSAYDSRVAEVRPEAFDAIVEIFDTAPRLARVIERNPELLDSLQDREFTNLEFPGGFGPDAEFETIARRGLVRVYWTRELGVPEMKEQLAQFPVHDADDSAEIVRNWSNDKVFQIGMHTMRGNLTPIEAGIALANVAEASIATVLLAVVEDRADSLYQPDDGGVAAIIFGDLASQEVAPRASLRILFVYEDNPGVDPRGMCHRFGEVLGQLTHDNLLFEPFSRGRKDRMAYTLAEFPDHCQSAASSIELLDLTRARCIFTTGDPGIGARFDEIRNGILARGPARDSLVTKLGERDEGGAGELLAAAMERGIRDVERAARYLQLTRLSEIPEIPGAGDAASIFQAAEAGKVIFSPVAEQLVSASRMWRSLRGIHRLVLDDDTAIEAASDTTRATLAECCDLPDFDALVASVRETAAATASGLESVFEQEN